MATAPLAPSSAAATQAVSPEARRALVGSAVGYAMDGFDLLILGFMLRAISTELGLTPPQAASLVTATLIGAVCGGVLFGMLADRLGRVRVLAWTILLFAVFTGLCALAQGYWDLLAYRTVAGLGLGGEFGIGMALVGEAWPAAKRARASAYVGLGWQFGVLAAALVTPLLLPVIGWRGMFAVGLFPAVAAFFIRRNLQEPDLFLEKVVRAKQKPQSLRLLVADAQTARISLGMIILCGVQNFGYYGVMIWLPNYLSTRFGYSLTQSSMWTAVTVLGMVVGIYAFGQIADRVSRRLAFLSYMLGAAIMVVVYSQMTGATALLIAGAVMGFFVNGMLGGYGALMSELYPTTARATAQNVLFNIGRGIGGFGPVVIGAIAIRLGFDVAIALLAVLYVIDMVAMWLLIPERDRPGVTAAQADGRVAVQLAHVVANALVNPEYHHLILRCVAPATEATPGQFFQLLCPAASPDAPFLRRPMSVYGIDPDNQQIEFLYKVTGAGTRGLASLGPGDRLDIMGPLGCGFVLDPVWRHVSALLVQGKSGARWVSVSISLTGS